MLDPVFSIFRSVGKKFDMGKSSLFTSFYRVIRALNAIAGDVIKWPDTNRRKVIENDFRQLGRIKGVVGAVDGTYVPIKAPREFPNVYINRKCFHGITLQAICDNGLKFTNCFAGFPSSVSDTRIFQKSSIYSKLSTLSDQYLSSGQFVIGDKAYPTNKFCIAPYIERLNITLREKSFNK